jgi:hypothetical protein
LIGDIRSGCGRFRQRDAKPQAIVANARIKMAGIIFLNMGQSPSGLYMPHIHFGRKKISGMEISMPLKNFGMQKLAAVLSAPSAKAGHNANVIK